MIGKKINIEGDDFMSNQMEKLESVETCNGPSLIDCCFDCDAHDLCKREKKCGGEYWKDFHGKCNDYKDYKCPHHPEFQLPPYQGIKLQLTQ